MTFHTFFTRSPIVPPPFEAVSKEIGADVEFYGLVRELEHGHPLAGLHYEAYEPMALKQITRIFALLAEAHPVAGVTWIHRLGWVPVGEASLFLRVQSAHRAEALNFCALAIDAMKRDVPIWKTARTA